MSSIVVEELFKRTETNSPNRTIKQNVSRKHLSNNKKVNRKLSNTIKRKEILRPANKKKKRNKKTVPYSLLTHSECLLNDSSKKMLTTCDVGTCTSAIWEIQSSQNDNDTSDTNFDDSVPSMKLQVNETNQKQKFILESSTIKELSKTIPIIKSTLTGIPKLYHYKKPEYDKEVTCNREDTTELFQTPIAKWSSKNFSAETSVRELYGKETENRSIIISVEKSFDGVSKTVTISHTSRLTPGGTLETSTIVIPKVRPNTVDSKYNRVLYPIHKQNICMNINNKRQKTTFVTNPKPKVSYVQFDRKNLAANRLIERPKTSYVTALLRKHNVKNNSNLDTESSKKDDNPSDSDVKMETEKKVKPPKLQKENINSVKPPASPLLQCQSSGGVQNKIEDNPITTISSTNKTNKEPSLASENLKWNDIVKRSKSLNMSSSLMDLIHEGEIKNNSQSAIKTVITNYLKRHPLTIKNLINLIAEVTSMPIFSNSIKCLTQIIITSHLAEDNEVFITTYIAPADFIVLLNSTSTVTTRFCRTYRFREMTMELFIKLLKIINAVANINQCRKEIGKITKDTLQTLCNLLKQQYTIELVTDVLDLFKVICQNRQNCRLLCLKFFYDSLTVVSRTAQNLNAVMHILKLVTRSKTVIRFMSQQERIISFFLELINSYNKLPVCRCTVTDILYKISYTEKGLKLLSKCENSAKLHNYFAKCKEFDEHHCRIKMYSVLNRFKNTIILKGSKTNIDLRLPNFIIQNLCPSNIYTMQDTKALSDDSSDEEYTLHTSEKLIDTLKHVPLIIPEGVDSITNMSVYLHEYGRCYRTGVPAQLRILQNRGAPVNRLTIEQRVNKPSHLNGIAFPDAAMLPAESDGLIAEQPSQFSIENFELHASSRQTFIPIVIFDLDEELFTAKDINIPHPKTYIMPTPSSLTMNLQSSSSLKFESRFESGNLRKAIQVDTNEYDLILNPDTLTFKGYHWFYFQITNMVPNTKYVFNVINFTKDRTAYNEGMLPVMFSVKNYKLAKTGWTRIQGDTIFRENVYGTKSGYAQCKTFKFFTTFPYESDYVYIASHFPYTYTRLMCKIAACINLNQESIYIRIDKLCDTINNANEIPIITITTKLNQGSLGIPVEKRPIIFLTARVHSGEANSSWIIEGCLRQLLKEKHMDSAVARECFVFKIIPMLNPEGVIYGNSRSGLLGNDLNRCWAQPSATTSPEIYHAKRLIEYIKTETKIPIGAFIDIHGHSRKKCFFFYGCNPKQSWNDRDRQKEDLTDILQILPKTIQSINPNIQLSDCSYSITKDRESTGRVVMWRELGITQSFTLECSVAQGYKKQSMDPKQLTEIGESVIIALGKIARDVYLAQEALPSFGLDYSDIEDWEFKEIIHGMHPALATVMVTRRLYVPPLVPGENYYQ